MSRRESTLEALLRGFSFSGTTAGLEISHISLDSRKIKAGGLFVALRGEQFDARDFIPDVLQQGASAVLVEDEPDSQALDARYPDRVIRVRNLRQALSGIAGRFYGHPSRQLKLVGITGTNGKTTIAWYLAQVLEELGEVAGFMGTLGAGPVAGREGAALRFDNTGYTTPDPIQVQQGLYEMLSAGVKVVCMEVSSHALELGRVADIEFDVVVFSNLSEDLLDFHHDMERYAAAMMRLFRDFSYRHAVINIDDPAGAQMLESAGERGLAYGLRDGALRAVDVLAAQDGLQFRMLYGKQSLPLRTRLIGTFNAYNMLAVAGVIVSLGYSLAELDEVITRCQPVPGRMQRIEARPVQPGVVVDYAHTPDALEAALRACRSHCQGVLSVVFGCGGDRDRTKRPVMGRIAESVADRVFITDDNPRNEPPVNIVAEISRGMSRPAWIVHDRAAAIRAALELAGTGDWVLIAGKGHECTQAFADRVLEFKDGEVAREALERQAA